MAVKEQSPAAINFDSNELAGSQASPSFVLHTLKA